MGKLKTWWKQKWCNHSDRRTVVVVSRSPEPTVATTTRCKRCGASCKPLVTPSWNRIHNGLSWARNLKEGDQEIIFDSDNWWAVK